MRLLAAIPALPVRDIPASVRYYQDKLSFSVAHAEGGFAILKRDAVEIHLWAATDDQWQTRPRSTPVVSGAESFLAGPASCRIGVVGIDTLYAELAPCGVVHGNGALRLEPWGDRDFAVVDLDNNLITFFERG